MPITHPKETEFLKNLIEKIDENISNEQFGVSELAREIGMSRSNLLRRIKKETDLSVSQFIRQVRLKKAMELLQETQLTSSEISFKVGFSSPSYFIKCFRDYYGYPPGEADKIGVVEDKSIEGNQPKPKRTVIMLSASIIVVIIAIISYLGFVSKTSNTTIVDKSIAVLPFLNDSNDSTNIYIINGLMESILNNLQKVEDLSVISRTSVEKYRKSEKLIPEIGRELNVKYILEGSGQKIGDQILLNIQLIEAETDKHLWAKQYNRNSNDIFMLQMEVAKNIADEIQVIITPEEQERISKVPTNNLIAYDYFLKGLDLFYMGNKESLEESILYFNKAIEQDPEFSRAYADIAIAYYLLDVNQTEKKYHDEINSYSDNALLFDPQLPQALIAKALYYMYNNEKELAVPYLEKAHEYNPNSALVINTLSDFYTSYIPNTEKYLEYALKGARLDIASHDSVTASYIYLHISNAFIQTGFIDEALLYIDKSLEYNPKNLYSEYVKAYILYAKNRDLAQTKELLFAALNKDSTRLDILQEVGKICYYMRDFESAYYYYGKYISVKEAYNLDIYKAEDAKIGVVLDKVNQEEKSKKYFNDYFIYAQNDNSVYKQLSLAVYYSYIGDVDKSIQHIKAFSEQNNYHYWTILFLEIDPLIDNIVDNPEFKKTLSIIKSKFWNNHKRIKTSLKGNVLL